MNARDFIINTLKQWEILFSGISVKYAYDECSSYHVITVEPSELYSNNEAYIAEESRFWDEFQEKFPNEDLIISEPNCCLEMKNQLYPEVERQEIDAVPESGKWFDNPTSLISSILYEDANIEDTTSPFLHTFKIEVPVIDCYNNNYALAA